MRNLPQVLGPQRLHMWNEWEEPESRKPSVPPTPEEGNIALAPMPAPIQNFDGLSFASGVTGGQAGAGWPPDTNGDVGPNHFIEAVNDAWGIFDKTTGTLVASFTENALWTSAGSGTPCDSSNFGDPVVVHDALADRWILTNFAFGIVAGNPAPPFYQCFAVSQTGDPVAGGWFLYAVRMDPGGAGMPPAGTLNDYPKFGTWTDCLYMSANEFAMPAGAFAGTSFASFSRTALYSGAALTGANSALGLIANTSDPFTMIPSNLLGTSAGSLPPAGTPNYFVSESESTFDFEVRKFTPGPGCGSGGTLGAPTNVSQTTYTTPSSNIVPQPPPATANNLLDSLGDRMMQKVQYRKIGSVESLWVVHSVLSGASSTTRPQWAQIDVSGGAVATVPVQQQIYAPDTTLYRWMGSLAVDALGNMALGYSTSNATSPNFPSIAYSGRHFDDPLNNLPQTETVLVAGAGSQVNSCGGAPCHRWGDYSAMSIDPSDDCTFWYVSEYYDSQTSGTGGNWHTRIGSFKFPTCVGGVITHTVTPSVNGGNGTIAPSTPQTVDDGSTTDFVLTPDSGFEIAGVAGTCGGTLNGSTFTTDPVTSDCTVIASFQSSGVGGTFPPDENFEEVTAPALPSDWISTASGGGTNWTTENTVSDTAPNAAFASEFPAVSDMTLDSPVFAASAGMTVSFRHQYNLEHGGGTTAYDGAVLEISINGGAFTDIVTAGGSFASGGYNSTVSPSFSSPIAGRAAWSGNSAGLVSAIANLPPSAAGQPCQLRWRTADDSSATASGTVGWWVDTIHLSTAPVAPTLAKIFTPAGVPVDTPSTVTLTLGNTNASADTLSADLTDTLPSGLVIAATPNASTSCTSGTVTATAGAGSFALLSGAQIPSGSCTVTVDVESSTAGSYVNTIAAGALQTDVGSNASPASATLTVTSGVGGTFPPDENFEEVTAPALPSDWISTASGAGTNWTTEDTVSDTAPNAAFASEFPAVSDMTLDSPMFTASAGMTISFRHQYNLEHGSGTTAYDGAVLEISINGGAFTDIVTAGGNFTSGGYNSTVSASFSNPIAGRAAWSGDSAGFVDAVATLPPSAAGQTCQLRWRTADDSSDTASGTVGWWVDTIHLDAGTGGSPVASITPSQLDFTLNAGGNASQPLTIGNTGGGTLTWSIVEAPATAPDHSTPMSDKDRFALSQRLARGGSTVDHLAPAPNPAIPQAVVIDEGFDDITTLPGAGWLEVNNSEPIGTTAWFQGTDVASGGPFDAFDGATSAYIGANYNNTAGVGTISNWLVSPQITFSSGASVSFYTRTVPAPQFPDRMQVRLCTTGDCSNVGSGATDVGDYTTLLLDINPNYTTTDYPNAWTQFTISAGLPTSGTGRIAFRYFVENAGPSGSNSDYIGIDRVVIDNGTGGGGGCANPADVPWLDVNPTSGSVLGGESQDATVTVDAASLTAGNYSAHLCVTTNDPASALVDVPVNVTVNGALVAPTLIKAFGPASVPVNTPSTVTLTLGNTNASMDTLTANLTDSLPSGLVVAATPNASTSCTSGTVTASAGAGSFALLSGAQIPSGSCTVTVDVESSTAGSYVNTIAAGVLQTDAGSNASPASATLTVTAVLNAPTLGKAFSPTSVEVDTPSTVTLTLGNTNASADTLSADLTDTLPSGLVVAATPNAATSCTGAGVTAVAGASSFALLNGAQIPSGSCTVTVDVESATAGSYLNTIAAGALQTNAGSNASPASAMLTVTPVVITDRIFCDGFDGASCPTSGIDGIAVGYGTRTIVPWRAGEGLAALDD